MYAGNRLLEIEQEIKKSSLFTGKKKIHNHAYKPGVQSHSYHRPEVHTFSKSVDYDVPGTIPAIAQPTPNSCWATVTTVLLSWRDKISYSIDALIKSLGDKWYNIYKQDKGLPLSDKEMFLATAGLIAEVPQSFSVSGWESLLRTYGPVWVTTDEILGYGARIHARIIKGIHGDGTPANTFLTIIDPGGGKVRKESIAAFIAKYEEVTREFKDLPIQVVHLPVDGQLSKEKNNQYPKTEIPVAQKSISMSRSYIIANNDNTAETRSFNPSANDKSGSTSISVRVPNLPKNGKIRWSVPPGQIGRYTLNGGNKVHEGNSVNISGLRPGITALDVEVRDSANKVLESVKFPICVPQFVTIDEDAANFDAVLKTMGVDYIKDEIIHEARQVCDSLLHTSNVRTIWRVGQYKEKVPGHIPQGLITPLTLKGEPPAGHPGLEGETRSVGGLGGWDVPNQPISIYPGAFDNNIPGGDPANVEPEVVSLVMELENLNMSIPEYLEFTKKVFGRLIGETMSHEIVHALLWNELHHPDASLHTSLNSLMDSGGNRTFYQRTGIEDTVRQSPFDLNHFTDHGIGAINKLHPDNQTHMNQRFPVPPNFI